MDKRIYPITANAVPHLIAEDLRGRVVCDACERPAIMFFSDLYGAFRCLDHLGMLAKVDIRLAMRIAVLKHKRDTRAAIEEEQ